MLLDYHEVSPFRFDHNTTYLRYKIIAIHIFQEFYTFVYTDH